MIGTMFSGAVTGVLLSKTADVALRFLQSSPVVKAVSAAMVDLHKHHKQTHAFIIGDDTTDVFRVVAQELEALEQNGTSFDPKKLATILRQRGASPPSGFDEGVEHFCQCLVNKIKEHPSLAVKYGFDILQGIQASLNSLQPHIPIAELDPLAVMAACTELSEARLDRFSQYYDDLPAWEDIASVALTQAPHSDPLPTFLPIIGLSHSLIISGDPGIGKTTMLRAITHWINRNEAAGASAIFIQLRDWEHAEGDLITYAASCLQDDAKISAAHLKFLALYGRLCLVIDGWNELSSAAARKLTSQVDELQRDYPHLTFVVSSRSRMRPPSVRKSLHLEVKELNADQRDRALLAVHADGIDDLADYVARHRELDELTRVPFYLQRFIDVAGTGEQLAGKEDLVSRAVIEMERKHMAVDAIEAVLGAFHREYLIALSVHMISAGLQMSRVDARQTVTSAARPLLDEGQIASTPDPEGAVEVLCDHHLLVTLPGDGGGAIEFPHQLFQEWFASHHIENLANNGGRADELAEHINDVRWGEAIGFAVDRLVAHDQTEAVVHLIRTSLPVEPLFAASLIARTGAEVWAQVSAEIVAFGEHWHEDGHVDRGLAFMIATGKPDFSHTVRQLFGHPNNQVSLKAIRLVQPQPVTSLGEGWQDWYSALNDDEREIVADEYAIYGGFNGLEFATEAALIDPSPAVITKIVRALDFRYARSHIYRVIGGVSDEARSAIFQKCDLESFKGDQDYTARRVEALQGKLANSDNVRQREASLMELGRLGGEDVSEQVFEELTSADFPGDDHFSFEFVKYAAEIDPHRAGAAIVERFCKGLSVPYFWREAPIELTDDARARARDWLIAEEGLETNDIRSEMVMQHLKAEDVAAVIEAELEERVDRRMYTHAKLEELTGAIARQTPGTAVEAIKLLHMLVWYDPSGIKEERLPVSAEVAAALRLSVHAWLELPVDDAVRRKLRAEASIILSRLGFEEDVAQLLEFLNEELAFCRNRHERFVAWTNSGQQGADPRNDHRHDYRKAFSAFDCEEVRGGMIAKLSDPDFYDDAAWVLCAFSRRENPPWETGSRGFSGYTDYSGVRKARARRDAEHGRAAHPLAEAVLDQVRAWLNVPDDADAHVRAWTLCEVATRMEIGNRYDDVLAGLRVETNAWYPSSDAFTCLTLAGFTIPSDMALHGYRQATVRWESEGRGDDGWWNVKSWMTALLFSDAPEEAHAIILTMCDENVRAHRIRDLMSTLGHVPGASASAFLQELLVSYPDLVQPYEWANALANRPLDEVAQVVSAVLDDQAASQRLNDYSILRVFSHVAAKAVEEQQWLREELIQKCTGGHGHVNADVFSSIAQHMIGKEHGDEFLIVALNLMRDGDDGRTIMSHNLLEAVRDRVLSKVPAGGNSYYHLPAQASGLRSKLYEIYRTDDNRKQCAKCLLEKIDDLRDEYGWPVDEPRHPDLGNGVAWPPIGEAH